MLVVRLISIANPSDTGASLPILPIAIVTYARDAGASLPVLAVVAIAYSGNARASSLDIQSLVPDPVVTVLGCSLANPLVT
jgi:hypothetical protein